MRAEEVKGLMEAYSQVHGPKELTEDQLWEEVESWVNSLLEEGYDLSEYTWEDMYETYLDEGRGGPGAAAAQQRTLSQTAQNAARVNSGGELGAGGGQAAMKALQAKGVSPRSAYATVYSQGQKNIQQAGRQPGQSTGMYGRYGPPSQQVKTPAPATPAPAKPTAPTKPAPTRTPAPAAKPTAAATTKPATSAPKPSSDGAERRTPTSAELKAAQDARASAKSAGQSKPEAEKSAVKAGVDTAKMAKTYAAKPSASSTLGQSVSAATAKPLNTNFNPSPTSAPKPTTPVAAPAPKPAPSASPVAGKSELMKKQLNQDLDLFDIIKGHLLDEGYAESEDAAMVIMVNMSEEWRKGILEVCGVELVEGLDPVGQEDDDVDNDGKKNTKSDKYLKNRRKVVGAAIQKEELEAWVDQLIAEGYDLSEYTWEEVAEIYAEELELAESGKNDARIRGNIKSFGSNYTPPRDWDQSANRGQGAVLNDKQKEKQRRKSLRQEELELGENRRMAADPEGRKSGYSKQPDPSKEGFTGIGNMSIKQIMAMNKKIAAKKKED